MTSGAETKGFCVNCKVLYAWHRKPRLIDARCPRCGMDLSQARGKITRKYPIVSEQPATRGAA